MACSGSDSPVSPSAGIPWASSSRTVWRRTSSARAMASSASAIQKRSPLSCRAGAMTRTSSCSGGTSPSTTSRSFWAVMASLVSTSSLMAYWLPPRPRALIGGVVGDRGGGMGDGQACPHVLHQRGGRGRALQGVQQRAALNPQAVARRHGRHRGRPGDSLEHADLPEIAGGAHGADSSDRSTALAPGRDLDLALLQDVERVTGLGLPDDLLPGGELGLGGHRGQSLQPGPRGSGEQTELLQQGHPRSQGLGLGSGLPVDPDKSRSAQQAQETGSQGHDQQGSIQSQRADHGRGDQGSQGDAAQDEGKKQSKYPRQLVTG